MKNKIVSILIVMAFLLSMTGCANSYGPSARAKYADLKIEEKKESDEKDNNALGGSDMGSILTGTQKVVVEGQDWGPAVVKTILELSDTIKNDSVNAEDFNVIELKESFNWAALTPNSKEDASKHIESETSRGVVAAYTSDENGEKKDSSNFVTIELNYSPDEGSPFCYDLFKGNNTICSPYNLKVNLKNGATLSTETGEEISELNVSETIDFDNAVYPQLAKTDISGVFEGPQGHKICYASYEVKEDNAKHPLVIWLHGAGEGGADPKINTLGNEVTALFSDKFQTTMGGAYVLAPQCPSFWMQYDENGNWMDNKGVDSIYLHDLKALIDDYVSSHSNIDSDRIIIGGCSNGGYMTMDMIMNYPDFFAAAYPICEAYTNSGITDEQLEKIKSLPIWFIYAENDTTVDPANFEVPTIKRLRDIGANIHTSIFKDVHDTSGKYNSSDGGAYQFMGHWSWIYFFNNECEENGVNMWQWMSEQKRSIK
ncbi:prolyl oligopeptidase family serine peptidase [Butyrivibrio sp. LC3010]|uniref:prolyl oligopeptidase family serine peptidase n=1 Tax=Butyrivibrio sp. LC3010 TaxID=1280680 RepID=UPI000427609E|nr:prolyl oligopeptidase family serine peptidase [Butyrivibrio sp. LC3010]